MKNSKLGEAKNKISLKDLPKSFERFELLILAIGSITIFGIVGFMLYSNISRVINFQPEVSVQLPSINENLLEEILHDLESKKKNYSTDSIRDPFQRFVNSTTTVVGEQ